MGRLKLSPNEEALLIRKEHERRRKLRLQQVREQERYIAMQIRREVQQRRERELHNLAEELCAEWKILQTEKRQTLETTYEANLQALGEGHRNAKENELDLEGIAQKAEESDWRAMERHRKSLKEVKLQRQKELQEQHWAIQARRKAIQVEKERTAKVASLPTPVPHPIENIVMKKQFLGKTRNMEQFSLTYYHIPDILVDREGDKKQFNARTVAEEEMKRIDQVIKEEEQERQEQQEKARLRGSHALKKELFTKDRERFMLELKHMQQTDLLRHRQKLLAMPSNIFQPLYKKEEIKEDWQKELEIAFEDMYTGERRVKGDLALQLVPEPLPSLSTSGQDEDLNVTLEPEVISERMPKLDEPKIEGQSAPLVQTQEPHRPVEGAPRQALKRLLNHIRSQRNRWSAEDDNRRSAMNLAEQKTSMDGVSLTIETGSLASEKDQPLSLIPQIPGCSHVSEGFGMAEESIVAGNLLLSEEAAVKILSANEKRKTKISLERKRHDQNAMLCDLEEQRCNLDLQLQDVEEEKVCLNSGIQKSSWKCDQKEAPNSTSETFVDKNEHFRRIHQYQNRLLEQNRLHNKTVEEAHRHLEKYHHTLRKHHVSSDSERTLSKGQNHCEPSSSSTASLFNLKAQNAIDVQTPLDISFPMLSLHLSGQAPTLLGQFCPLPDLKLPTSVGFYQESNNLPLDSTAAKPWLSRQPNVVTTVLKNKLESVTEKWPERLQPSALLTSMYQKIPSADLLPVSTFQPFQEPTNDKNKSSAPTLTSQKAGALLQINASLLPSSKGINMKGVRGVLETKPYPERQIEAFCQKQRVQELLQKQDAPTEQIKRQRETLKSKFAVDSKSTKPVPEALMLETGSKVGKGVKFSRMNVLLSAMDEYPKPIPLSGEAGQTQRSSLSLQPVSNDKKTFPQIPKFPMVQSELVNTGIMELSTIQEVDTPVNTSLVADELASVQPNSELCSFGIWSKLECKSGKGSKNLENTSSNLSWRDKLGLESGLPSRMEKILYPSASRRTLVSQQEFIHISADHFSSSTLSTGSFYTTEPNDNSMNTDDYRPCNEIGVGSSSYSKQSSNADKSSMEYPLQQNSSVKSIIDKYTKELNISLSAAGSSTGTKTSSFHTEFESGVRGNLQEWDCMASANIEHDNNLSSILDMDHVRQLGLGQPIGDLMDQSSSVGKYMEDSTSSQKMDGFSNQLSSASKDLEVNSTLSQKFGQFFDPSSSHLSNKETDLIVSCFNDQNGTHQSSLWHIEGLDKSRLKPRVGEIDLSCAQQNESSGNQELVGPLSKASFQTLLAEVTDNDTVEHSVTFHTLEEKQLSSHYEEKYILAGEDVFIRDSQDTKPSATSLEHLRAESGPSHFQNPLLEYSLMAPLYCSFYDSDLWIPSVTNEQCLTADITAPDLLSKGDVSVTGSALSWSPEGQGGLQRSVSAEPNDPLTSGSKVNVPPWERILEASAKSGILEESELIQLSMAETTLEEQVLTPTEDDNGQQNEKEMQLPSIVFPEEDRVLQDGTGSCHPMMLMEFQSSPSFLHQEALWQKYTNMPQRLTQRIDDLNAKWAGIKSTVETQNTVKSPKWMHARCQSEQSLGSQTKLQQTQSHPSMAVREANLKKVGLVSIGTPQQRGYDMAEKHRQTKRSNRQLDEVRQLTNKGRQESYPNNRLMSKENLAEF